MNRRLGIINISEEYYEDGLVPELVDCLQLTPKDVTYEVWNGRYRWTCESPMFGIHTEGSTITEYIIKCESETKTRRKYYLS